MAGSIGQKNHSRHKPQARFFIANKATSMSQLFAVEEKHMNGAGVMHGGMPHDIRRFCPVCDRS